MFPTISIGHLVFPTTGLILIFGAWLCLTVIEKADTRLQLDVQKTYTLATVALFAGFVGARLTFVLQYWPAYQENLLGIIWPLTSGYNATGGLIVGVTVAFFYGRAHQLPPLATLDALTPGILLGFMTVSLADFLGGPGFGTLTAVPWGISQYGLRRHPVQLYEMLAGLLALVVWWQMVERRKYEGQLFLTAVTIYSATRLFLDAFRDNAWLTANGYHLWQIVSLGVMLVGLFLLTYFHETQTHSVQKT
ncbi:MAG: prolipoprotein diacylglyceryl transferase [Chloroflexi bacterium]|nr:prolipoprotein diacylglyceryl transferase [Chloroflexota bacterium]